MQTWARVVLCFLISGLSAGCSTGPLANSLYGGYSIPPLADGIGTYGKLVSAVQAPGNGNLLEKACFAAPVPDSDKAKCLVQRNQTVSALVISSTEMCLAHRRSMYGNEAMWNITLGTMTNLFAGAASVVHKETLRPVLAALALFSNSERSLVNETVYKQMLVTAVDKKIVEMRETRLSSIYLALKTDINAYGAHETLRDVVLLHNNCSFMEGLQKALDEGTQDSSAKKIGRLRATLHTLTIEYTALSDKTNATGTELKGRIEAVSAALKAEEVR